MIRRPRIEDQLGTGAVFSNLDAFESGFGSKPPSTILVSICIGRTKLGAELRRKESLGYFLYRKLQSAYPEGSTGIGHSFSGKGRPSTVVPNQIQSRLYSKNMSLLV